MVLKLRCDLFNKLEREWKNRTVRIKKWLRGKKGIYKRGKISEENWTAEVIMTTFFSEVIFIP